MSTSEQKADRTVAVGTDFLLRVGRPQDTGFIVHSWRRSRAPFVTYRQQICYRRGQDALIAALLERSVVRVAHEVGEPDTIVGWACGEPAGSLLHWVYVRRQRRRRGVANALIDALFGGCPQGVLVTTSVARPAGDETLDLWPAVNRRGWRVSVYGGCYLAAGGDCGKGH
jgi:GNAT superfamily N-acetyltransferase